MDKYQEILGINQYSTKEEIDAKYQELKKEYTNKMFSEGEEGANAANFLRDLDIAYQEAIFQLSKTNESDNGNIYYEVENALKEGQYEKAQSYLDKFEARDSMWHFYQSNLFFKKNWFTDSKKQLEIALQLDPNNQKAKTALTGLEQIMSGENVEKVKVEQQQRTAQHDQRQMGGMGCNCCDCLCAALLCQSCGGC